MSDENGTERLTRELMALADRDQSTPCQSSPHRDRWTSDDPDEREWAAHMCRMCPLLRECGLAADDRKERWHVYGGRDRSVKTRKAA
jgi:hypothetical protein